MNNENENELRRLTEVLRNIDAAQNSSEAHEALAKAGLALSLVFLAGARENLEEQYADREAPLTEEQRQKLSRLGL